MSTQEVTTNPATEPKFEQRGFAAAEPSATEVIVDDPDAVAAQIQSDMFAAPEAEVEPEAPTAAEAKIKIGDKEFTSQQDAFNYANELAQKDLVNDAFRHGLDVAQKATAGNQVQPQAQPQPEEEIPVEIMYDPKRLAKYISDKAKDAKEAAKQEIDQLHMRRQTEADTWNKFYNDYPDLIKNQDLVRFTLDQNWANLSPMDTQPALKILAEKVRARKKEWLGEELPGKVLPQVRATASPGSHTEVTKKNATEKPLSFVEIMRQNSLKKKKGNRAGR